MEPCKDQLLNKLYQHMLNNPPYHNGHKNKGSACNDAFWKGYGGTIRKHTIFANQSFAHAAWRAGKDFKKTQLDNPG